MPALKCLPVLDITKARADAVALNMRQHLVQLPPKGGVHGVHRLRAIEHQVGNMVGGGKGKAA